MAPLADYFAARTFEIRWPRELVAAELDRLLVVARQPVTNARRTDSDWHEQCDHFIENPPSIRRSSVGVA